MLAPVSIARLVVSVILGYPYRLPWTFVTASHVLAEGCRSELQLGGAAFRRTTSAIAPRLRSLPPSCAQAPRVVVDQLRTSLLSWRAADPRRPTPCDVISEGLFRRHFHFINLVSDLLLDASIDGSSYKVPPNHARVATMRFVC